MHTFPGYQLHTVLHDSPRTLVFQAVEEGTGRAVILKSPRAERPQQSELARLRHEYGLLKDLADIGGVIRAVGLVSHEQTMALVLEDVGARSLRALLERGERLEVAAFVAMGQALCKALGAIHARHVIHKDINPNNVVVSPEHPTDARVIDFGLASRLSRENAQIQQTGHWVGTLAYISPEQTGRMNRPVDYRTDLYSLGATFYHALTGAPPFDTRDPMELVHAHMARAVVPPSKVRADIPPILDEIVLKLLAKAPEDRYQSADGVGADLSLAARWLQEGRVEGLLFRAGERDAQGRFLIPEHLYGRRAQIEALLEAFGRAERGAAALVLVEGVAGAGKTALIQEVLKPITRARGNFVRGKCELLRRNVPYAALLQGLEPLVASLLTLDAQSLAGWREKLAEALGPNGALITRLLPALALVIGPQPEPGELTPAEAQNRFNRVFRSFLMAFAGADHPLVIALDDLQWADSATLKLLEVLLAGGDTAHLLIIGSAREEEVDAAHPLTQMLEAVRKASVDVTRLEIGPLGREDVVALLKDTLRRDVEETPEDTAALGAFADLLLDRTHGNAFFLNQLLLALHQDKALVFDQHTRRWTWDMEALKRAGYRAGVEGLIADKIRRLPPATQKALQGAACAGSVFELAVLAAGLDVPFGALVADLGPALQEGLIEARGEAYVLFGQAGEGLEVEMGGVCAFLHDHIRQAALLTLPAPERAALHLRLGRLRLKACEGTDALEAALFDILGHLHLAQQLAATPPITDPAERLTLAKLALRAGKKARDAVAFDAATKHLAFGALMLGEGDAQWAQDPALAFELLTELGRGYYLTGAFAEAEALFEQLSERAPDDLTRAHVVTIKMTLYLNTGRLADVIEQGLKMLAAFGHTLPPEPGNDVIGAELTAALGLMQGREIDSLKDLPAMSDLGQVSSMALLFFACIASYLSGRTALWQVLVLRMVRISIEKGNTPFGAYAYPAMAMIIGPGLGDYKAAHAWGRVGVDVGERSGSLSFRCVANFLMGCFIDYWGRPLRESIAVLEQAFQDGIDSGNLIYCAYCLSGIGIAAVGNGQPLSELSERANQGWVFSRKIQYDDIAQYYPIYQQFIRALTGKTQAPTSFNDDTFDEDAFIAQLLPRSFHVPRHMFYILKMQLGYLFGDLEGAQKAAEASEGLLAVSFALHHATDHHLYRALIDAAAAQSPDQVAAAQTRLEAAHAQFSTWSANAPANFEPKVKLLEAESARLRGDQMKAMTAYVQAADLARLSGYLQIEAIACERLGTLHLQHERPREGKLYLSDAAKAYARWGATGKVRELVQRHALRTEQDVTTTSTLSTTSSSGNDQTMDVSLTHAVSAQVLDLAAVLKASRALSGEIVLERLLTRLMNICVEAAGAQRGIFFAILDELIVVEAERDIPSDTIQVLDKTSLTERKDIPQTLIRYVARTAERIVLGDARRASSYQNDPAVVSRNIRSVLCQAITSQGKRVGVLYLENNLAADTFTSERCELLESLGAQAAISIENARLYETLEQRVRDRTKALQESLRLVTESQQRLADELSEAAAYVRSLLPERLEPTSDGGPRTDWCFIPSAALGGDAFGYRWLPDGSLAMYLLDVCGHGMASALLSISVLNALQRDGLLRANFDDPGHVLSALNDAFPASRHNGLFFTIWYGVFDPRTRALRFASAGHPPAVLVRTPHKPIIDELCTPSPMIGILPGLQFESQTVQLNGPAHLFIFSDGAYELSTPTGDLLKYETFLDALTLKLSSPPHNLARMVEFAQTVRGGQPLEDDFSMLEVVL